MSSVEDVYADFQDAVNMTPKALEAWLETGESQAAGQEVSSAAESTGHTSGRRIVEILRTKKADLADDDAEHMGTVVAYVRRHSAQRPDKSADELQHSRWTASLKNWGHDPLP